MGSNTTFGHKLKDRVFSPFLIDNTSSCPTATTIKTSLPDEVNGTILFYEEGDLWPLSNADKYNVAITFFKELSIELLKW
jgi:hypothetical protein